MNDKVNREGWFRKKGGRGHADKSSKRRYIILTERYLDWYTAPVSIDIMTSIGVKNNLNYYYWRIF